MVCSRVIVAADTHTGALIAAVMVVVVVVIVWRHYHVLCLSACIPNGGLLVSACTPFSPSLPSFLNRLSQCTIRRNVFQRVPLLMVVVYVFWKCNSLHTHTKHCCSRVRSQHTQAHTAANYRSSTEGTTHFHSHRLRHRHSGTMATTTTTLVSSTCPVWADSRDSAEATVSE